MLKTNIVLVGDNSNKGETMDATPIFNASLNNSINNSAGVFYLDFASNFFTITFSNAQANGYGENKGGVEVLDWGYIKPADRQIANEVETNQGGQGLNTANNWLGYAGNYGEPGAVLLGKSLDAVYNSSSITTQIWNYGRYAAASKAIGVTGKVMGAAVMLEL